jgi:hypothetical protein
MEREGDDVREDERDGSASLDLVTVFRTAPGAATEMESLSVKSLLEASGIDAVIIGDPRLPPLSEEVRVPRRDAARAGEIIREALAAGPRAAEEAEAAGEQP